MIWDKLDSFPWFPMCEMRKILSRTYLIETKSMRSLKILLVHDDGLLNMNMLDYITENNTHRENSSTRKHIRVVSSHSVSIKVG